MREFTIIGNLESLNKLLITPTNKVRIIFRFLLAPLEINGNNSELSIKFKRNQLQGEPFK